AHFLAIRPFRGINQKLLLIRRKFLVLFLQAFAERKTSQTPVLLTYQLYYRFVQVLSLGVLYLRKCPSSFHHLVEYLEGLFHLNLVTYVLQSDHHGREYRALTNYLLTIRKQNESFSIRYLYHPQDIESV